MTYFSKMDDIWELEPTKDDLIAGAKYAAITLPWTFDRMMINTGSRGQQSRALNISKGIVVQEILRRELRRKGKNPVTQEKSHREKDLFDFNMEVEGQLCKLDIKSFTYYSDYPDVGRSPLTKELIIENRGYCGHDWRCFFPMLVPHTQILQPKEAYCFVIASSTDPRQNVDKNRFDYRLTAFPYGEPLPFLSSKRLCLAREGANKGIYINCTYKSQALFNGQGIKLIVIGEWAGNLQKHEICMNKNSQVTNIGPFSCVSSFQISMADYERMFGLIEISIGLNELGDTILNASRRNINTLPCCPLTINREDFTNLILPTDYKIFVIGWISKKDFVEKCKDYVGWVWPLDKINKYANQPWSQITENDKIMIKRIGFGDCVQAKPSLLTAGLMKTTGKSSGACCYVFTNIGYRGGVKETNLYVLPQDLHIMNDISGIKLLR